MQLKARGSFRIRACSKTRSRSTAGTEGVSVRVGLYDRSLPRHRGTEFLAHYPPARCAKVRQRGHTNSRGKGEHKPEKTKLTPRDWRKFREKTGKTAPLLMQSTRWPMGADTRRRARIEFRYYECFAVDLPNRRCKIRNTAALYQIKSANPRIFRSFFRSLLKALREEKFYEVGSSVHASDHV